MTRIALLTEVEEYSPDRLWNEQLISVGGNSGNNAYVTALLDIYSATRVNYSKLDKTLENDEFDIYIVGNLSWIVENTPTPDFYYDAFKKIVSKGKRFVPISVGTQVSYYKPDFMYHPLTLNFLKEISDQALIGCRGEYTAEMLYKNGVKNIEVIGCPSLFHGKDPNFKILKRESLKENPKVATGITPWENENMSKDMLKKFIIYCYKNNMEFIEQADIGWIDILTSGDKRLKAILENYFKEHFKIFFNITEWREYSKSLDFSFGGRFHGNVIPLLEGVPALFISIDARTREMCDYFKFPTIDITKFNYKLSIEELYELADYSNFNKQYPYLYKKFRDFSQKNNLILTNKYRDYL